MKKTILLFCFVYVTIIFGACNEHNTSKLTEMEITNRIVVEKGIAGRLSTWPVSTDMMDTVVGAEYAIKWINGEVQKEGVDVKALKQLMEDYAGVEVYLTLYTDEYPYTEEGAVTGETYDNILLVRMDYITFE